MECDGTGSEIGAWSTYAWTMCREFDVGTTASAGGLVTIDVATGRTMLAESTLSHMT
jgi:hypothetical protein